MNSNEEVKAEGTPCHRRCGGRRMWKIPFIVAAVVLIKSAVVFVLWNHLIPDLFHWSELTYLQAIELTVLVKVLVGFGGGGPHHHFGGRHGGHWKAHFSNLSPEEREKMREEIRKRCSRHS